MFQLQNVLRIPAKGLLITGMRATKEERDCMWKGLADLLQKAESRKRKGKSRERKKSRVKGWGNVTKSRMTSPWCHWSVAWRFGGPTSWARGKSHSLWPLPVKTALGLCAFSRWDSSGRIPVAPACLEMPGAFSTKANTLFSDGEKWGTQRGARKEHTSCSRRNLEKQNLWRPSKWILELLKQANTNKTTAFEEKLERNNRGDGYRDDRIWNIGSLFPNFLWCAYVVSFSL